MNSHETNRRNIEKMEKISEPIFSEEKKENKIDIVTEEAPFSFGRRIIVIITAVIWVGTLLMGIGGGDFSVMMPFMVFSLGITAFSNIPKFLWQKKKLDTIIAIIGGTGLVLLSVAMLIRT